ncbi:mitochondrial ornithine carrier protein [Coemansia asiatica]|uniref:Mitochondrial ornithine carrier protein n=1 Tax=Coemansia asiatica TaxID=1052880 RepID=A0A9W7XI43_9FUNG|nr:mitochondrial ornithine carrier protein [Coemansia asiatica]
MEGEIQALGELAKYDKGRPKPGGLEDLAFGSLAGMMGKFVEYPFDTVKVRLQTSESQVFSGTIDCLRQTFRNEGFGGFYRGLTSPLVGAMAENAIAFYAYNRIQSVIRTVTGAQDLNLGHLFLSGGISGAICAFVISPVELVKCKLQVENVRGYGHQQTANVVKTRFTGPLSVVTHLLRTEGVAGLYRGIGPTVARETLGVGFWFGAYEVVCRQILASRRRSKDDPLPPKDVLGPGSIILAGGCAGIAYNITSYPIDVVKSFIQTSDVRSAGSAQPAAAAESSPTIASTIRAVYSRGGIPAFYRGLGITLLRAFPANAAMFMTYEYLSRLSADLRSKNQ